MWHVQEEGYTAVPSAGAGPGVLVLHPWWGLSDAIKDFCERLAEEGFVAYAPDLYHGKLALTIEEAEALSGQLDGETADADIARAVDHLWQRVAPGQAGIGVVGFSLGAFFALRLSSADPERVRAVVLFYGTGSGDFGRAKAAYLGHYAATDPYEPAEEVAGLETALKSAGRPTTFFRYESVGHWFFEADRPDAFNETAARLAWERTVAFLQETVALPSHQTP
jgi:carboxymethylenebutenolidase